MEAGHRRQQQEQVEGESQIRHQAGEPVVDEHEHHHRERGSRGGDEPLADGIGAERRPHRALLQHLDGCGQRARAQHDGQVGRLLGGEAAGDLGAPGGNALPDLRRRVDVAVQHDREAPAHVGLGELREGAATRRVEVHRHVRLARGLVDRDPGGGHVSPGHVGLLLHHEGDLPLLVGLLVDPALVEDLVALRHPVLERTLRVHLVVHQLELEQRSLADEGLGPLRVLHARQLHQDAVLALLLDRGLGHPELVDAVPDRLEPLPHREIADLGRLARLQRHHDPAGRLVRLLALEVAQDLADGGERRVPALGRADLDHELGGAASLDLGDRDALLVELGPDAVARPFHLRLHRLGHVDAQHQVDAALQIEPEVDGLARRVEEPDRHGHHGRDEADADPEVATHLAGRLLVAPGGHDAPHRGALELHLDLVRHLQRHGVLRQAHHGTVEAAGGHHAIALLDRAQQLLALLPLLLLRPDDEEVHDREHADHEGQDGDDAAAVASAGRRRPHRVREIHHEGHASESGDESVSAEPPRDSTP